MRGRFLAGVGGVITLATLLFLGGFFVAAVAAADSTSTTRSTTNRLLCGSLDTATAFAGSNSHIVASAKWSGFTTSSRTSRPSIKFQVALATEGGVLSRAFNKISSRCLSNTAIEPDLTHWHEVDAAGFSDASFALKNQHDKSVDSFLIVKAIDAQGHSLLIRSHTKKLDFAERSVPSEGRSTTYSCPCSDPSNSAADFLNSKFGRVFLPINYGNNGITGNKDDDDGYSAITKAGIVIATVVGPTILLALLILLLCGGAAEAGFSGGGVVATEFPGVRGNLATENQATAVERSYPSTALDLNQKIEAPADANPQQSGRTNLSNALQSKTPSDRDYRTAAGI